MTGRKLIPLFLLAGVAYVLILLRHILVPFVLAAAIAYTLNPLVAAIEMRGVKRQRAVMLVYVVLVALFVGLAYLAISTALQSATNIGKEMPAYVHQARSLVQTNLAYLENLPGFPRISGALHEQLGQESQSWMMTFLEKVPELFRLHIFPLVEMTLLVPFLVFFFMLDGPAFLDKVLDLVPARHVEMTLNIFLEISYSFGNYLRGIMIQAFFMGVLAGIGYGVIGLHYAVHIAIWVALSSMIPFLGPFSAAFAGGVVAFFQWGTMTGLLKVLAIYGMIRFLDDWMLHPLILRRAIHIHPVLVVFTLMAGAYLGGLWGLLFAVPAACMIKVLIEVGWQWYQTEYGLQTPTLSPATEIPVV